MNSTEEECRGCEIMEKDAHVRFLELMYYMLPSPYESQEINHLTLAYFVISGLDILNSLHKVHTIILFLVFALPMPLLLLPCSLFICNLMFFLFCLCDLRSRRMLLSVGFCLSKLTLVPRLISMMVCMQMHLLARFDLQNLIFDWPIWRVLLQDNSMAFMGPKLRSFLQMRMGYGKCLKF